MKIRRKSHCRQSRNAYFTINKGKFLGKLRTYFQFHIWSGSFVCPRKENFGGFFMKKRVFVLAIAVLLCVSCCFVACREENNNNSSGTFSIVLDEPSGYKVYTLDVSMVKDDGIMDALKYLETNEGVVLDYTVSTYGAYFKRVGNVIENATNGSYVYFYTNKSSDFDVSAYATTFDYNGTLLTSSGLGVNSMTVENGTIILVSLVTF